MKVFASTVERKSHGQNTGNIYKIDWPKQHIERHIPVPAPMVTNLGPRGGRRGGRGICVWNETIIVANYDTLNFYDHDLELIKSVTNPLFCGLHEICHAQGQIWVASTGNEGLFAVDPESGELTFQWFATEDNFICYSHLKIPYQKIDRGIDHRLRLYSANDSITHLNCVSASNGHIYITFSHQGVILQILPEKRIRIHQAQLKNPHNGVRLDKERFVINDTGNQTIRIYDANSGEEIDNINLRGLDVKILQDAKRFKGLIKVAAPGWLRGLAIINNSRLLVGVSPSAIIEVDIDNHTIKNQLKISDDIRNSIHGLAIYNSHVHSAKKL